MSRADESIAAEMIGGTVFIYSLDALCTILRVVSRLVSTGKLGIGDWCMITCCAFNISHMGLTIYAGSLGIGKCSVYASFLFSIFSSDFMKRHAEFVAWTNILQVLRLAYAEAITYFIGLGFCRQSILSNYYQLSPEKKWRSFIMVMTGVNLAFTVIGICISAFQCHPIASYWDPLNPARKCLAAQVMLIVVPAMCVVLDLILLFMPAPVIIALNTTKRRKLQIMGIGLISIIVSCVRIAVLVGIAKYVQDSTWVGSKLSLVTGFEIAAATIAANIPAIRILCSYMFGSRSKSFSAAAHSSSYELSSAALERSQRKVNVTTAIAASLHDSQEDLCNQNSHDTSTSQSHDIVATASDPGTWRPV